MGLNHRPLPYKGNALTNWAMWVCKEDTGSEPAGLLTYLTNRMSVKCFRYLPSLKTIKQIKLRKKNKKFPYSHEPREILLSQTSFIVHPLSCVHRKINTLFLYMQIIYLFFSFYYLLLGLLPSNLFILPPFLSNPLVSK